MALTSILHAGDFAMNAGEERRVYHHLDRLESRLAHHPEPKAELTIRAQDAQRRIQVDLRVELGPLGPHVVSHQAAETIDAAVRLAVDDVERQIERGHSLQQGEHAFGVPSRRLPKSERPHPPGASTEAAEVQSDLD